MSTATLGAMLRHRAHPYGVEITFAGGLLSLSLLDPGILRVRAAAGPLAPRRSWAVAAADEEFAPVPFALEQGPAGLRLAGGAFSLTVDPAGGALSVADAAGRPFAGDLGGPAFAPAGPGHPGLAGDAGDGLPAAARSEARLRKALAPDEVVYGLGQRIGLLDRRGRQLSNWTVDPQWGHGRGHDNLYQAHPTMLGLRPGLAWGLFLNSSWHSRFDVGLSDPGALALSTLGGELDYYLIFGPAPAAVVERLTRLTGRPLLPPLWALGYHQSRWGYADAEQIRDLARSFRARDIPLDVAHLDIDHMRGYRCFTWDPERFADPAAMAADLAAAGVRVVTIIDPGIKHDLGNGYAVADSGLAGGHFIGEDPASPFCGYCWPELALFPDFARPAARAWWAEQHRGHLEAGVAGIWNDMNEPAIFDRPFHEGGRPIYPPIPLATPQGDPEERSVHAELHNLYGHLMGRATFEGLRRLRPGARPWVLTRSAFTGTQRYAAAWMGDNNSWWEHLEASLPQLMSMGLGGQPHVGVDIGGFFDNCSPELYARWVELGTFYPFMRTHSAAGTADQEPWSFGPEVEELARRAIKLRYRLLPYLYTLAHQAHRSGAPLLRPLAYDFPDDPATYHLSDQAMLGPHLLVAPATRPGQRARSVYLPAGRWYDWHSGQAHQGPADILVATPLGRPPLFVRGGAALPLGDERPSTAAPLRELTWLVYPAGAGQWALIEDAGDGDGPTAETALRAEERPGGALVALAARQGAYAPPPRRLTLAICRPAPPREIRRDGAPAAWSWDDERRLAALSWDDDGAAHTVEVIDL